MALSDLVPITDHRSPTTSPAVPGKSTRQELIVLASVVVLAAALRLYHLGTRILWVDELFSAFMARAPWRDFAGLVRAREVNMLLYYVLLRPWAALGSGSGWLRGLSVLAGVATIPVLFCVTRRLFGTTTATIAALLLALNAYHIRYSQEARSYALAVLLVSVSFLFFVRCVQRASRWDWALYAVASALAVYGHVYAVLIVFVQACAILWWPEARLARRDLWRGLRLTAYLCVPLLILAFSIGSAPVSWLLPPDAHLLRDFVFAFCGNDGWLLVAASVIGVSVFAILARSRTRAAVVLSWLVVPITFTIAASSVRPVFQGRYLIVCLPALAVALACTMARLPRWGMLASVAVLSLLSLQGVSRYYANDFDTVREDWWSASKYLSANVRSGDAMFFFPGAERLSYEYFRPASNQEPTVIYPRQQRTEAYGAFSPVPLGEAFATTPNNAKRVWLVLSDSMVPSVAADVVRHWCGTHRMLTRQRQFDHLVIETYDWIDPGFPPL